MCIRDSLNFGAGIGAFEIPLPSGVQISEADFHAPLTGSPFYSDLPWEIIQTSSSIRWQTLEESAGSVANPLRWGWLYNFSFVADVAPVTSEVLMDSHADSPFSTLTALTQAPPPPLDDPPFRRGLCNSDDFADVSDVMYLSLIHI